MFAQQCTRLTDRDRTDAWPRRRGGADLTVCTVDGDLVILDRTRGYVHQLNATASHIWSACDGRHSVDDIAATLGASFTDAPRNLRDAVVNTLSDFNELGLLMSPLLPDDAESEET